MAKGKGKLTLILIYSVVIAVAGYAVYRAWNINTVMGQMSDISLNQYQGNADAEKIIVEFLDYRCSYCRQVHATVKEVLEHNPDVKVVYRHFPVFGRPSVIEAEVALAAGMQGKFSEAHEYLMSKNEPITEGEIDALVTQLGIDREKFRVDMKGPEIGYLLLHTLENMQLLGIRGTPTFMVGNVVYTLDQGMPTRETFEQLLQEVYGD